MSIRPVLIGLFLAFIAAPASARAETVGAEEVVSPLVATPIASPNPVLGSDAKIHLAYEIVLMSMASGKVTIEKVETLDAANGSVLGT